MNGVADADKKPLVPVRRARMRIGSLWGTVQRAPPCHVLVLLHRNASSLAPPAQPPTTQAPTRRRTTLTLRTPWAYNLEG